MKATDLALARARNGHQQQGEPIHVLDIGEGWGFLGFELQPRLSKDKDVLGAVLYAVGTKQSLIAQTSMTLVKVAVAPLAEVKLEKLREAFAAAEEKPKDVDQ